MPLLRVNVPPLDAGGMMRAAFREAMPDLWQSNLPRLPANVIEWFETPGFLFSSETLARTRDPRTGLYLFPKAFAALRDFFDLLCPYCQNSKAIQTTDPEGQDLRSQILLRNGVCPQCKISIVDVQRAKRAEGALEFVLALGMGSGKTSLLGGVAGYITGVAASLPSVREAFGFSPGAPMEMAFVASTATQTRKTIWAYFTSLVDQSPWWKRYREAAADSEHDLMDDSTTVWRFPRAGFECQSLNSNSGGQVGLRRLGVFIDELARFDVEGKRGANEVYQGMSGSMKNTQILYDRMLDSGQIPPFKPMIGAISSPISEFDKVMSLGREAQKNPASRIFFRREPTWKWNSQFDKADFARELARDPRKAMRDFGAEPLGIKKLLFDPGVIDPCIDLTRPNLVTSGEDFFRDKLSTPYVRLKLLGCPLDRSTPRFVHCDPGESKDSFGICIGHSEWEPLTHDLIVILDAVIEIRPYIQNTEGDPIRHTVHFESVYEVLLELCKRLHVVKGSYDQWQSVTHIQRLRHHGYDFQKVELEYSDWTNLVDLANNRRLSVPKMERDDLDRDDRRSPITKLVYELKAMEDLGNKADHPADGSSDLAVCAAGVSRLALLNAGLVTAPRQAKRPPPSWLPISSLHSVPPDRRIGSAVRWRRY